MKRVNTSAKRPGVTSKKVLNNMRMTNAFNVVTREGLIESVDSDTSTGVLKMDDEFVLFCFTWFDSGRPWRSPMKGECVEVLLSEKGLVLNIRTLSSNEN